MIVKCRYCNADVKTKPSRPQKFCSRICWKRNSWKKTICLSCKEEFIYKWKGENARRKYCSLKCCSDKNSPFKRGHTPWNKGKVHLSNEKNPNWKGDDVSYSGLHYWVNRELGRPEKCEFCGKNGLSGRQIHWANKDHKYKRNLDDWLRLCVECHLEYDGTSIENQRA